MNEGIIKNQDTTLIDMRIVTALTRESRMSRTTRSACLIRYSTTIYCDSKSDLSQSLVMCTDVIFIVYYLLFKKRTYECIAKSSVDALRTIAQWS